MGYERLEYDPTCVKCGAKNPTMKYLPAIKGVDGLAGPLPERISLKCFRCGFTWTRLPLDAPRPDPELADLEAGVRHILDEKVRRPW